MAFERRQFLTTKNLSDNGLLGKDREILIDKTNKRVGYCDENGTLESMANVNELPDLDDYATKNFVTNLTGDLANLATTDKSNLVAAINEATQSGGGSGDSLIAIPTYDLSWTSSGSTYKTVIDPTVYGITSDYHKYAIALWCEIDCKATSCTALATANGWTITIYDSEANPSGQQYGYLLIHKTNRQVIPQGGSNLPLLQCLPSSSPTPSGSESVVYDTKGSFTENSWAYDSSSQLYYIEWQVDLRLDNITEVNYYKASLDLLTNTARLGINGLTCSADYINNKWGLLVKLTSTNKYSDSSNISYCLHVYKSNNTNGFSDGIINYCRGRSWTMKIIPVTFTNSLQSSGGDWVDAGKGLYSLTLGGSNGMPSMPTQADANKIVGYWEDNFVISGAMTFPSMLNVGTLLGNRLTIANSYNSYFGEYDLTATIYANSLPSTATTGKLNLILLNGANQ